MTSISLSSALSKAKSQYYYRFLYLSSPEIVNGCKAKQTTAIKYCKSEQIKATMLKLTRQNRCRTEAYQIGLHVYTAPAHTGLLFISPPKRSDFCSASRTGLLWRSVNSSRIRYENRYAPMQSGIV